MSPSPGFPGVRALAQLDVAAILERRAAEGEHERAQHQVASIIDVSGDLSAAKADRANQQKARKAAALEHAKQQAKSQLASGAADFRARFMAERTTKQELERKAELARQEAERIAQERRQALQALAPGALRALHALCYALHALALCAP